MPQKKHAENKAPADRILLLKAGNECPKLEAVKISIVVPAFNEERLLGQSLARMISSAGVFVRQGWGVEFIVCDNNSTDRTAEIARNAGVLVVFEPVNQIARARNRGAAAATGDWLIFVDADSQPSAGLFEEVAEQIQSGRCLAGGTTVRMDEKYWVAEFFTRLWNCSSRMGRWLAGSFIFVEAATFRELGGFNNELFAAEELDLSRRLKQRSRKTGRGIVILHRHPLMTSARKLRLYTLWDHLKLLTHVLLNRRALTRRDSCALWYDGRR
ncbi:MAG TPA: glycosyltransferase [Candidatus Limnocylindrales bacterium]|nr:glycosyltransferase [Candidatus Limnocylindrales bacterium]